MAPPIRSLIWKYFKPVVHDADKSECKVCNKLYSRKGRTTSSLKYHLKSKHPAEFSQLQTMEYEKQLQTYKCEIISDIDFAPFQEEIPLEEKNHFEDVVVKQEISWETDIADTNVFHSDSNNIDKLIGEMIVLQNLPFSFVDGRGFHRLMQEIAPEYTRNLGGSEFFTNFVCNQLYGRLVLKVKELIEKFHYMSFTIDVRKYPGYNASLLFVTCHGISENFQKSSVVLKCESLDDDSAVDIFSRNFDNILHEWNIPKEQVHCIIYGKGYNMNRVCWNKSVPNELDCTVYKLQLVIKESLQSQDNIKEIELKCQRICAHFYHSSIAQKYLKDIEVSLNQPHLPLFDDGMTHWESTYDMFERFLKVKVALNLYFKNSGIDPRLSNSPEEWKIIECYVLLLKPFEEAIQELWSLNAHISYVIPIIHVLKLKLDNYLNQGQDHDPIRHAATTLKTELISNFSELEQNNLYTISTYLDPRFKHKLFNRLMEQKIKEEIACDAPSFKTTTRMRMSEAKPGASVHDYLAEILDSSSEDESVDIESDSVTALKQELLLYSGKTRLGITEDPLHWWSVNSIELKNLSAIARRYLSPLLVVPLREKQFSNTVLFHQSSARDDEKVARLLFVKFNAPVFNFNY